MNRLHVEHIEGEITRLERIDQALDDGEAPLAGGVEDQRPVQRKALDASASRAVSPAWIHPDRSSKPQARGELISLL